MHLRDVLNYRVARSPVGGLAGAWPREPGLQGTLAWFPPA